MKLVELLTQKRSSILNGWIQGTLETYPADARKFLGKQKDRFANPVGHTITKGLEDLYSDILQGKDSTALYSILDRIIRIRAVQDLSPSEALSFIFLLKRVIREELQAEVRGSGLYESLLQFESRLDDISLLAFEIYMKRREKIYEIRANEAKNQVSRLLQKAGLIVEIPEWKSNVKKANDM